MCKGWVNVDIAISIMFVCVNIRRCLCVGGCVRACECGMGVSNLYMNYSHSFLGGRIDTKA